MASHSTDYFRSFVYCCFSYAIYLLVLVFSCGYHRLFTGRKTVVVYLVCKSSNVKVLKEGFCTEFISHFYSIIGRYCVSRHRGMNFVCKSGFIELKKAGSKGPLFLS